MILIYNAFGYVKLVVLHLNRHDETTLWVLFLSSDYKWNFKFGKMKKNKMQKGITGGEMREINK